MHYYINNFEHILKRIIKLIISSLFFYSGFFFVTRIFNNLMGRRLTIVAYHRVTKDSVETIRCSLPYMFVSQRHFDAHIKFYKKYYNVVRFEDIAEYEKRGAIPPNSLIITFDDGYADNYLNAFPILKKYNVPATIFLATDFIEANKIPWWDEAYYRLSLLNEANTTVLNGLQNGIVKRFKSDPAKLFSTLGKLEKSYIIKLLDILRTETKTLSCLLNSNKFLNVEQLLEMKTHVEYGSHTCSHISLENEEYENIMRELLLSKDYLSFITQSKVNTFAYPTGHYSRYSAQIVKQSGYDYAVTLEKGINNIKDKLVLKRINMWEGSVKPPYGNFSKSIMAFTLSGFKL